MITKRLRKYGAAGFILAFTCGQPLTAAAEDSTQTIFAKGHAISHGAASSWSPDRPEPSISCSADLSITEVVHLSDTSTPQVAEVISIFGEGAVCEDWQWQEETQRAFKLTHDAERDLWIIQTRWDH